MSEKVKFFKLWAQLNKENIFSQKDCFMCSSCKYAERYLENTQLFKNLTAKHDLNFTKCKVIKKEHWKVSYSYCPDFNK